ncbi:MULTISPECIES: hypothetical protein [Micromonospora]|uniref:hypothetical protein n=1 Tax=Micromonospora TaxID=1873 RepID=UPI001145D704|nr:MULTISPECIES: hypothetical protein [Micromonospora]
MRGIRTALAWRKLLLRAAVVLAASAVILPTSGAPAQAAEQSYCGALSGSYANGNRIGLCMNIFWYVPSGGGQAFYLTSDVLIDPAATGATGCKVTAWVSLDKPNSNQWQSPKNTQSCTSALSERGTWQNSYHFSTGTSATEAQRHACIDLYYNGSSSSGWQRCMSSGWEQMQLG